MREMAEKANIDGNIKIDVYVHHENTIGTVFNP